MLLSLLLAVTSGAAASDSAVRAFERAERRLAENRLDEAAAGYRQAIAERPDYAEAINGLGSVLFKRGDKEEAIAQFKKAIAVNPKFKLAYFNLGYALRKTNDFEGAARAYEKYVELDPGDPDGFYGLGESYRQLGQRAKASDAYEQFIAKETRPSEKRWVEKAKEYVALLKSPAVQVVGPGTGGPLQPRATGVMAEGFPAAAGVSSLTAMALHQVGEGDRLMEEKKYRRASFAYEDAVKVDPSNVEALFKLANSEAELGYYTHAIVNWSKAIQLTNDVVVRNSAQQNIQRARGKIIEVTGLPLYAGVSASVLPPTDPARGKARAAYEQGVAQINSAEYAAALQSLNQAIELQPELAMAYVARGSANMGLQRYAAAQSDYESALRWDANLAAPLYGLGEALEALGLTAEAAGYFERYAASTARDARSELQLRAKEKADKLR